MRLPVTAMASGVPALNRPDARLIAEVGTAVLTRPMNTAPRMKNHPFAATANPSRAAASTGLPGRASAMSTMRASLQRP